MRLEERQELLADEAPHAVARQHLLLVEQLLEMQEVHALEVGHARSSDASTRAPVYNPPLGESRMQSDAGDVLEQALAWREQGRGVALATVIETWGSSPRPAGSLLAVDDRSGFVGSVSGGCIEGAVVHEALQVIADGRPRTLEFGVTNEMAWEVGLACGGRIRVFVERVE